MKQDIDQAYLEQLAAAMAAAIPTLECPDCCETGWRFTYLEASARRYQEEWEWACFAHTLLRYRLARCREPDDKGVAE